MKPFAYQKRGIQFLARNRRALLADEPGLGKTFQAIRACDAAFAEDVLIVCPASVIGTWKAEIAKFATRTWNFHVTSYEMACGKEYDKLMSQRWDTIILDEAHYLKTLTSKRTKKIYGFSTKDGYRRGIGLVDRAFAVWLLTGTPMPNDPSELFPHLRALAEERIHSPRTGKVWSMHQFINAYCVTKNNGFGDRIVGAKNADKLHRKLNGFMLRRYKRDVLKDLPPLRFGEIQVDGDLSGLPAEEVQKVKAALEAGGFQALKEIAGHVGVLRRLTGLAKIGSTIKWLQDWLANSTGKIVVFAYHRDVIAALHEQFGDIAVGISGSTSQADREDARERFQTDPSVRMFIGQITAASTGITLTAASDLLFVESSWVPAEIEQAAQRIHRIGQKDSCLVRFAMIPNSIDEDIQRAVARKVGMIERVIEGVS
ncbi:DEAD/DEAH box helicase [Roseibium alexandrii]|uniref:DEAD/DEAH box helicase n=1 Tax=Roseibium alexandrii TaxID=388408 RepID=UPI00375286B6